MNEKQKQMAEDAQKANKPDWAIDDLFEAILERARKEHAFMVHAMDEMVKFQSYDFDLIFGDYAKEIGKDNLNKEEKQIAFLNHVLEQGLDEEE